MSMPKKQSTIIHPHFIVVNYECKMLSTLEEEVELVNFLTRRLSRKETIQTYVSSQAPGHLKSLNSWLRKPTWGDASGHGDAKKKNGQEKTLQMFSWRFTQVVCQKLLLLRSNFCSAIANISWRASPCWKFYTWLSHLISTNCEGRIMTLII